MSRIHPLRALQSADATEAPTGHELGTQLQLLIAQGDDDWVQGIAWQVNHRIRWLIERDRRKEH